MAMEQKALDQLRIDAGEKFRLKDHSARWLPPAAKDLSKADRRRIAEEMLATSKEELAAAQEVLYADGRHSVLILFQAMDAAGKDGTISHVMSGVNPQGCSVSSFKVPSAEELSHNYLWRYSKALPARGMIGIFNRSYYEETLVVRVHPSILDNADLPPECVSDDIWAQRFEDINNFEQHLARNGTTILKFFLNVSKEEQKQRFLERLETPEKNWKFSSADIVERGFWDDYMKAFEEAITATSTPWAPWYVIPADRKWAMRAAVADIITTTIQGLPLAYPQLPADEMARLADAKEKLLAE